MVLIFNLRQHHCQASYVLRNVVFISVLNSIFAALLHLCFSICPFFTIYSIVPEFLEWLSIIATIFPTTILLWVLNSFYGFLMDPFLIHDLMLLFLILVLNKVASVCNEGRTFHCWRSEELTFLHFQSNITFITKF